MIPSYPFEHTDPSARLLTELNRYDFKKSPISFNVFYQGLEDHVLRELDSTLHFESTTFTSDVTIDTSEHPLCFAFALGVKIMCRYAREASLTIRACLLGDEVKLQIICPTNSPEMRMVFEKESPIFEHLSYIARFETVLEFTKEASTLSFNIPLYNEKTFQFYTPTLEDLTDIFQLISRYVDDIFGER